MSVEHDSANRRFVMRLATGEAVLRYDQRENVLDFYDVYVPPAQRGQGAAGRLVVFAFEWAREHGFKVLPTCPFIAGEFLPRFPQFRDVVVGEA